MQPTRLGITRRIQALRATGWSTVQISRLTGLNTVTVRAIGLDETRRITPATAQAVYAAYQRAAYRQPPSRRPDEIRVVTQVRADAKRRGWAPPMAWDDIDHDDRPKGIRRGRSGPIDLDDVLRLLRAGVAPEEVADRVGVQVSSLGRRLRRQGYRSWAAYVERKPL